VSLRVLEGGPFGAANQPVELREPGSSHALNSDSLSGRAPRLSPVRATVRASSVTLDVQAIVSGPKAAEALAVALGREVGG
jgi:hypothetical protein